MNLQKISIILITFLLSFINTFALDAPTNLNIDKITDTSVDLSWDQVDGSMYYYIYFGNISGGDYESQTDLIETNSFTLDSLEKGKKYYAVVSSIDDNGIESDFSEEVSFSLKFTDKEKEEGFVFTNVEIIDFDKLELSFSQDLENKEDSIREFKIINKSDDLDEIEVKESKINKNNSNKLDLLLDSSLIEGVEYELVVIALNSIDGKNIEFGIDSTQVFRLEKGFKPKIIENETIKKEDESDVIELNSADKETKDLVVGDDLDNKEVNDLLSSANENNKLPDTGPEHILIFILTFILATLIFIFKYKKV